MNNEYKFPILYKRNNNGKILSWAIIVQDNFYYTVYGCIDGVLVYTPKTICSGKNIGKSNETTPQKQAYLEAESKWKKKIKSENYIEDLNKIKSTITNNIIYNPPMLALKYDRNYTKDMKYVQPKLDGIRCNISYNSDMGDVEAISRKNHPFKYIPHILKSVHDICKQYPSLHLDGELYNHELKDNFEELVSLIRKDKEPTVENKELIERYVEYHIYDIWDDNNIDLTFKERNDIINKLFNNLPHIVVVPTIQVNSAKEIDDALNVFLKDGYEGCIIRLDKPYEHKRSKCLLKYKLFNDDEFPIIDIVEGVGKLSNVAGYCIIQLPNNRGTCKCNIKGNMSWKYELLHNKENYIGKLGTVTYFEETNDGKLRFPYLKTIRDYE